MSPGRRRKRTCRRRASTFSSKCSRKRLRRSPAKSLNRSRKPPKLRVRARKWLLLRKPRRRPPRAKASKPKLLALRDAKEAARRWMGGLFRACAKPFVAKFVQPSERSANHPCFVRGASGRVKESSDGK